MKRVSAISAGVLFFAALPGCGASELRDAVSAGVFDFVSGAVTSALSAWLGIDAG